MLIKRGNCEILDVLDSGKEVDEKTKKALNTAKKQIKSSKEKVLEDNKLEN